MRPMAGKDWDDLAEYECIYVLYIARSYCKPLIYCKNMFRSFILRNVKAGERLLRNSF